MTMSERHERIRAYRTRMNTVCVRSGAEHQYTTELHAAGIRHLMCCKCGKRWPVGQIDPQEAARDAIDNMQETFEEVYGYGR